MLLVRLRQLLGLRLVIHMSFAEYHSKRNPVERVHAVQTKELEKHGPFKVPNLQVDTLEHKKAMYEMREDVEDVLKQAQFGGKYTMVTKGVGEEKNFVFNDMKNLYAFLAMNEDQKAKCANGIPTQPRFKNPVRLSTNLGCGPSLYRKLYARL